MSTEPLASTPVVSAASSETGLLVAMLVVVLLGMAGMLALAS